MSESYNIKRVCGFYVSAVHLITMLLPYINKELNLGVKFCSFLAFNLKEQVDMVLSNLIIEETAKENVKNINWNKSNNYKYAYVEKELKKQIGKNTKINILITGNDKYIKAVNENLEKFFEKYSKKIEIEIAIINCYEVAQFNDNIKNILDIHEQIINTSGIHAISDIFDGYEKEIAN